MQITKNKLLKGGNSQKLKFSKLPNFVKKLSVSYCQIYKSKLSLNILSIKLLVLILFLESVADI